MALPKLDIPRYETKIPSTNKKVVYRPYVVKEEKILMIAMESNDQTQMIRAVKDIISSCTENTIDADSLTMFDIEYMFTQLRAKSVGEVSKILMACTNCSEKNEVSIDLSKVKVDAVDQKSKKIKLTNNVSVALKYPSVKDIEEIAREDRSEVDIIFDLVILCIDSIYSADEIFDAKEQSKHELTEFVESLNSEQFSKITEFVQNTPAVKTMAVFDCQKCGTHNEIEIKGLANFFS